MAGSGGGASASERLPVLARFCVEASEGEERPEEDSSTDEMRFRLGEEDDSSPLLLPKGLKSNEAIQDEHKAG